MINKFTGIKLLLSAADLVFESASNQEKEEFEEKVNDTVILPAVIAIKTLSTLFPKEEAEIEFEGNKYLLKLHDMEKI